MGILRLLLALSVIASHVGPILGCNFIGGSLAVQAFFIISGFYMSLILNEKYIGENNSYRLFISNRLLRLYPSYLVVLLLTFLTCIILGKISTDNEFPILGQYQYTQPGPLAFLYLIFTNVCIWGQDIVMFLGIDQVTGKLFYTNNFWNTSPALYNFLFIPQGWSLALELTFYLFAPFLLRKSLRTVLVFIAASLIIRIVVYYVLNLKNDPWTYRFFPTEIVFFLLGNIAYRLYKKMQQSILILKYGYWLLVVLAIFILVYNRLPSLDAKVFHFALFDIVFFVLITVSVPILFICFKNSKIDKKIGELSYPVYISHLLMAMICQRSAISFLNNGLGITVATIIVSMLIVKFIIDPLERVRQRRVKRIKTAYPKLNIVIPT